jgi:hypothetical protein
MAWGDEKGPGAKLAELVREKQINEKAGYGDALIWNEYEYVGFPGVAFTRAPRSTITALLLNSQFVIKSN